MSNEQDRTSPKDSETETVQPTEISAAMLENVPSWRELAQSGEREVVTLRARVSQLRACLEAIQKFTRSEVCKDDFAYDRMVDAYRQAAQTGLEADNEVAAS